MCQRLCTRDDLHSREEVEDLRLARIAWQVRHLHSLGERSVLEFLIEFVGTDHDLKLDLEIQLDRYTQISHIMLDAVDGRDISPPIFVVEGGQR